ncbi:MAG: universal stress protein [Desulfovibrionaceae bacterium]
MKRHLLVAISDDASALYGVRFVASFFTDKQRLNLTLYSSYPRGAEVWEEEKSFETLQHAEEHADRNEIRYRRVAEAACKRLTDAGFPAESVDIRCTPRAHTKAMDIIQEGERGLYDAVVLGRRAVAWLERLLDESVSRQLLMDETGCPTWVCRHPEPGRRGVLLCLDGSEPAYRMADHVGFILAGETAHPVTLFHLRREGNGGRHDPAEIFARGRRILEDNGLPPELILEKEVETSKIVKSILAEADQGEYAVVAVGRTGSGGSFLQRMFMGSVSHELLHNLDKAVLWFTR